MKAVFLVGGKGSRMKEYHTPKPLLKVQNKTVPEWLIELFKKYKVKEFIFSVAHDADDIMEYYGDGSKYGVKIIYIEEKVPMGSAGALKLASKHLTETFFVTNGDELKDINLEQMYHFHKNKKALVTVALVEVEDPREYGVARIHDNFIEEFEEKPDMAASPSNLINSGLSIWEPEVLKSIPERFSMYETDVFPVLAKKRKLCGFMFSGQWFDTGTPERYDKAKTEWRGLQ